MDIKGGRDLDIESVRQILMYQGYCMFVESSDSQKKIILDTDDQEYSFLYLDEDLDKMEEEQLIVDLKTRAHILEL